MSTTPSTVAPALNASHQGDIQLWSRTLIPTTKEAPSDAEAISHKLLMRAGFIRRVGAGIYNYLPMALRTLEKISAIVRQEMNAAGASEMLMPAMEPIELMHKTGRDTDYGDNLFKLTDRHGRIVALAPTHEEIITDMMKGAVNSYRQLPLNLYQIQTKFRDEFRPRSGLLRCREFIMKDAYSFHMTLDGPGGLDEGYEAMRTAYINIFTRCGLDFSMVEAQSGPIGGSASHEFMVNCDAGEDVILHCPASGYTANAEKCATGDRPWSFDGEPTGDLDKVHTPDMPTIEDVGKFLKVKPRNMLKTIVFENADFVAQHRKPADDATKLAQESGSTAVSQHHEAERRKGVSTGRSVSGTKWVVAVVRGDHDVNEGKVKEAVGFPVVLAEEREACDDGFVIGYVSPRAVMNDDPRTVLIVDPDAAQGMDLSKGKPMFWAAGADEKDHHVKHFNWRRELGDVLDNPDYVKVADIRNAMAGDPSPKAEGAFLEESRGIEVGHIFKLGSKYSEAMGFEILNADQQRIPVIMGCYGIGVSRTLQACVEMSHDDDGIIWPAAIAPYHVLITPIKVEPAGEIMLASMKLAQELSEAGMDVLVDDRNERPGVKFKDADLIGVPIRLTIGDKALSQGCVEFKSRGADGNGELVNHENVTQKCLAALQYAYISLNTQTGDEAIHDS